MDQTAISNWVLAAISLTSLALSVFGLLRRGIDNKIEKLNQRVDDQDDTFNSLSGRVQKVESEMAHLPDLKATHRLEMDMAELKSSIAVVGQELRTNTAVATRLQEFLLEQAKGR